MLTLLFVADVIGSPGREVLSALLPDVKRRYDVDLVICNAENTAAGFGLTRSTAKELLDAGVDVMTGGNHLWDRKESVEYLGQEPKLVRPANLPDTTPGRGWGVFEARGGTPVGVVSLLGRVFMKEAESPFRTADKAIEALRERCKVIFVDIHAEATAEKVALAWHVDGRVSAVVGTHTHVQTADERILPKGTALLTDAGMTGGFDSVIGMEKSAAIRRFLTLMPERLTPAGDNLAMNAVLLRVDPASGKTASIQRLQIPHRRPDRSSDVRLLKGAEPAEAMQALARKEVAALRASGVTPVLALVSVGEDPASRIYLKAKSEACAEAGIVARRVEIAAGTSTAEVVERVRALGNAPDVHGILVQLPLAAPAESDPVLEAIPPWKDVDGFHPMNVGRLALGLPALAPATPRGIVELLRHYAIPLEGRHAVILGRSNIVGRPLATLLSSRAINMTVTMGHSKSGGELRELSRQADLLVAAIGQPESVGAEWVKPGATVVDVGIHRVPDATRKSGTRLTGDVNRAAVSRIAGAITPVPGGVGPMTVAMVVMNTVLAAQHQNSGVRV